MRMTPTRYSCPARLAIPFSSPSHLKKNDMWPSSWSPVIFLHKNTLRLKRTSTLSCHLFCTILIFAFFTLLHTPLASSPFYFEVFSLCVFASPAPSSTPTTTPSSITATSPKGETSSEIADANTMHQASLQLRGGLSMPQFGFGTYRVPPGYAAQEAVSHALHHGYRLIDTAALYRNEADVGKAVRNFLVQDPASSSHPGSGLSSAPSSGTTGSGGGKPTAAGKMSGQSLSRQDFFITTKLWDSDHGYDKASFAFEKSLKTLDLEYIDLYLIHSPNRGKLVETWDALLEKKKQQKVRILGVSNWGVQHFELLKQHGRELPEVNQIELHPLNYKARREIVEYCEKQAIVITAYGSLLSGRIHEMLGQRLGLKRGGAISHSSGWFRPIVPPGEVVPASSKKPRGSITTGQMLLRWGLQKNLALIPKSVHEERVAENADIWDFELTSEAVEMLDALEGELNEYWDPLDVRAEAGDINRGGATRGGDSSSKSDL
ncbi:unnamed protein product [Amoebophrya sp. A120]|nr:unnamed protein product [Amoebophrya sp. A120]|eukprot:GSA120T00000100001.1